MAAGLIGAGDIAGIRIMAITILTVPIIEERGLLQTATEDTGRDDLRRAGGRIRVDLREEVTLLRDNALVIPPVLQRLACRHRL